MFPCLNSCVDSDSFCLFWKVGKKEREERERKRRDERLCFKNSDKSLSIHFDINYTKNIEWLHRKIQ